MHLMSTYSARRRFIRATRRRLQTFPEIMMNPHESQGRCEQLALWHGDRAGQQRDAGQRDGRAGGGEYRVAPHLEADAHAACLCGVRLFNHNEHGVSVSEDIFARGMCLPSDIKNTDEDMDRLSRWSERCLADKKTVE